MERQLMKVLLVDDEALARVRLRSLLEGLPSLQAEVIGEAGDAEEALALQQRTPADVVLLDIGMPGRDGLRLAALLSALPQAPAIVFVTAHAEHALQAFELEAVDYLTKPVRSERLLAALQRVQRLRHTAQVGAEAVAEVPVLVVTDRGRVLRLPVDEVLYAKAELKYVTLRTAGHGYVLDDALSDLEVRLQALGGSFIRVHRNALVARRAVRALEMRGALADGWAVQVAPLDEWLAVSRRQVAAVRSALAQESG